MKRFLAAFLLILSARLCGADGGKGSVALLWLPAPDAPRQEVMDSMGGNSGFGLTVAVPAASVPAAEREKMRALSASGRLELPLRMAGDPVLPLLFSPSSAYVNWQGKGGYSLWADRMDEAAYSLYLGLEGYKKIHKQPPEGWTPAGGGLTPDFVPLAATYGLKWLACGRGASQEFAVLESSGVKLVSFETARDTAALELLLASAAVSAAPVFAAIDETLVDTATASALRGALRNLALSPRGLKYMTVSAALAVAPSTTVAQSTGGAAYFPPPWSGDYSPWAANPRQSGALLNLGAARKACSIYRSASQAKAPALKQASALMAELDTGARLLRLAGPDPDDADEAENQFKTMLENVYRVIERPMPPSLVRPLSDSESPSGEPEAETVSSPAGGGNAVITEGDGMLLVQNPEKRAVLPPGFPLAAGATGQAALTPAQNGVFNPDAVLVRWTSDSVDFRIKTSRADDAARRELLPLLLADIYIDLNHRPGFGSVNLLEGRQFRASAEDAWEFAVVIASGKARLYQATPQGPSKIGEYDTALLPGGDMLAEIPRTALPGTPSRWGYLILTMPLDRESGAQPKPLANPSGGPVADYMSLDRLGNTFYFLRLPAKFR
ncbi:MAG: hypothetical protein WC421_00390 [Elusimicrobiales bacterium]